MLLSGYNLQQMNPNLHKGHKAIVYYLSQKSRACLLNILVRHTFSFEMFAFEQNIILILYSCIDQRVRVCAWYDKENMTSDRSNRNVMTKTDTDFFGHSDASGICVYDKFVLKRQRLFSPPP